MVKRYFHNFYLGVMTLVFFTLIPCFASAEGESPSGEQETQICSMGEEQKKSAAEGAYDALKEVKVQHDSYIWLQKEKLNKGDCASLELEGFWDGSLTNELGWGEHDKKGATIGEKYKEGLLAAFENVEELSNTDLDIAGYILELNEFISIADNIEKGLDTPGLFRSRQFYKDRREAAYRCKPSVEAMKTARDTLKEHRMIAHQYLTTLSTETPASCTCDSQGNLLECVTTDDTFVEDDVEPSGCRKLNEYMADLQMCPTCKIFESILRASQELAAGSFEQLAPGFIKLLGIAFLIFIGYQVLQAVASPATQTPAKLLGAITAQGFKVAIGVVLLSNPEFVYNTLISPIIYGGFDFGLEMSGNDAYQKIKQYGHKYQQFDSTNQVLTASFLKDVMGAIEAFNEAAATMPSIGRSMLCNAWVDLIWYVLPHFSLLIEGGIVYVFGMIILLAVGFYLLDTAITLALVCCLMPIAIASWPFKMTSKYTTVCWNFVMNIFFSFVMVGIVIKVTIDLTVQAISTGMTVEELTNYLDTNNVKALELAMDLSGLQLLMLVICCMISSKLIKDINSLANKFAPGAPTGGMGSALGGLAASVATSAGKSALRTGGKVANHLGEASGISGAGRAMKAGIKNKASKVLGKAGIGSQAKSKGGRQDNSQKDGSENTENNSKDNQKDDSNKSNDTKA